MNAIKSRLRLSVLPALLHLGISASIALLAMVVIFRIWYPGVMAEAQGVSQLVLIMIAVDVVIGPLITFLVYVPGKKALHFDLTVISAVQTVALLYGLQAIHGGRPAYLVFNVDRFDVTAYQEVDDASHASAAREFQRKVWGFRTLSARLPEDKGEREKIMFDSVSGGPDLRQLPHLFLPLEAERDSMLAKLHPMSELKIANELDDAEWSALLQDLGRPESELGYLPMAANLNDGAVILDRKTGEIIEIRMLIPSFSPPRVEPTAAPAATPEPATDPSVPAPSGQPPSQPIGPSNGVG